MVMTLFTPIVLALCMKFLRSLFVDSLVYYTYVDNTGELSDI